MVQDNHGLAEVVEGDWKSFRFQMVKPSDFPAVLLHLRNNFYRDEPLCYHAGYNEEMADDFDIYVTQALEDNLSIMAVDKATNKVAGVRITAICRKGEHHDLPIFKNPKTGPIVGILMKLTEDANVFEKHPEISEYADFFMVSVDRDFRGSGLATELYDRTFKMLRAMKMTLIKCIFTSPYSQKIAWNRHFQEVCRMKFLDWKDDNGKQHYPDATEEEVAILMVKDIK